MLRLRFLNYSEEQIKLAVQQDGCALQFVAILSPAILDAATAAKSPYAKEYAEALKAAGAGCGEH